MCLSFGRPVCMSSNLSATLSFRRAAEDSEIRILIKMSASKVEWTSTLAATALDTQPKPLPLTAQLATPTRNSPSRSRSRSRQNSQSRWRSSTSSRSCSPPRQRSRLRLRTRSPPRSPRSTFAASDVLANCTKAGPAGFPPWYKQPMQLLCAFEISIAPTM
jgi:hypothetical protein